MSEKEFSALDHKEQELFSNKYTPQQDIKRPGGNYMATELPHSWGDSDAHTDNGHGSSKSFGLMLLLLSLVILITCKIAFRIFIFL